MNTKIDNIEAPIATTPKRRRRSNAARVQIRLTTAEKAKLATAARRAGYVHLARYLIDLHRGRVDPASPLDSDAVRAAVRAEIETVTTHQMADLSALAETVERLRAAVKDNFGGLTDSVKSLAARLPTAPRVGGQS